MNRTFRNTKWPSACTGNCNQGRSCTCELPASEMACTAGDDPADAPPVWWPSPVAAVLLVGAVALLSAVLGNAWGHFFAN